MDNRAIGVFDSGFGGLTAVRRVHEVMPGEDIVYFGDSGRLPYGTRGREAIIRYTRQDIAFLRTFDLKAIIVACGTVSSVALDTVSCENDIAMFGVVEPACQKALRQTRNGKIGVIGTPGTIRSGAYERCLREHRPGLQIVARACPLFVPLVENGRVHKGDVVIETMVREYLAEVREAGIDTLILGCTHYPLLREVIGAFMGSCVSLVDPGAEAADFAKAQIEPAGRARGTTRYFVSDDPAAFDAYAALFLNKQIDCGAKQIDIASY